MIAGFHRGLYVRAEHLPPPDPPKGGKRGAVKEYSKASRRRLLKTMAALRWEAFGTNASFVTLTLHRVPDDWHEAFQRWLQAARRMGCQYIWRLELQKRGAPHWHVIIWGTRDQRAALRRAWRRIGAYGSHAHARYGWHSRVLDSHRAATAYVAKYVAKCGADPEERTLEGRRRWGTSRSLPLYPYEQQRTDRSGYYALRRIARRMLRARARDRKPSRYWGSRSFWLYMDRATQDRLLRWLPAPLECDDRCGLLAVAAAGLCASDWRPPDG